MLTAVKRSVSIRVILTLPEIRPDSLTLVSDYLIYIWLVIESIAV